MLKALDGLPTDQKEVIVLGVFQDLSYAQMEEITGKSGTFLNGKILALLDSHFLPFIK